MDEVFVIERMVVIGVWELMSPVFYTDEKEAQNVCSDNISKMRKINKGFNARVTKIVSNKYKHNNHDTTVRIRETDTR